MYMYLEDKSPERELLYCFSKVIPHRSIDGMVKHNGNYPIHENAIMLVELILNYKQRQAFFQYL